MKNESVIKYGIALCLFAAMTGLNWDVAWHILLVRESMWQPPHLVMYVFVGIAIMLGILGWVSTRSPLWRKIAIALFGIPTAICLDELWHIFFFEEEITSIWMTLSPPHLLVLETFIYTAYILCHSFKDKKSMFGQLCMQACTIAIILNCLLVITMPMDTLRHFHGERVFAAWIVPFVYTSILFFTHDTMRYKWSALLVTLFYISLAAFSFPANSPGMIIMPYEQPILWISITMYVVTAVIFDCVRQQPNYIKGSIVGLTFGLILYGFSFWLLQVEYQYSIQHLFFYIFSTMIGGLVAAVTDNVRRQKI